MSTIFEAKLQDDNGAGGSALVCAATPANGTYVGISNTTANKATGPGGANLPLSQTFDAVDNEVTFASIAASGTSCTYYMFVRITGNQNAFAAPFECRGTTTNVCGILFPSASRILGYIYGNNSATYLYTGGPVIPTGKWVLIAVTATSGGSKFYVIEHNGTSRVTTTTTHAQSLLSSSYAQNPRLGNSTGGGGRYFGGLMAGVRIDDTALAQATLEAYFDSALPVNTVAPAVTGTLEVGSTLTCAAGTWSNGTKTYQWYTNTSPSIIGATLIGGATATTYVPTYLQVTDKYFFCRERSTSDIGFVDAYSNFVGPIPLKVIDANVAAFNVFNSLVTTSTNLATATLTKPEYDWSGISWKGLLAGVTANATCNIACILISNTHAIASWHCGPAVGDTIDFRNPAGTVYTLTVAAVTQLGSDLRLVRFSTTPHASLKRMPFLTRQHWFTAYTRYLWQMEWSGAVAAAVPATIDRNSDALNLGASVSSSGKPSLAVFNDNSLALVGIHHYTTIDERFSDNHLALIAAALVSYGETITYVPVPNEADRPIVDGPLPKLYRARWR